MKISVWICNNCEHAVPCVLPVHVGKRILEPFCIQTWAGEKWNSCPYYEGMGAFFELKEIEAEELISYFANKPCKHYFLTQMCKGRGGICPKECDGNIEVCLTKEGIQRGMRK